MAPNQDGLSATYARPEGSKWTPEQWAAIAADGRRLLVAAAAGSGKTAVLVERIITRIADESNPLDVDALLVATFTKAAAAEMKERIRLALEGELEKRPDSVHLRRQLALLPRASITTLHSFCMEVVERYAPTIGLDPGLRIANETEAELLRMDTLDELFEERYGEEGERGTLAVLADAYGGERSDEPLHRLVLELYGFSRSHPWPAHWLRETAARFQVKDPADLAASPWVHSMRADVVLALEGAVQMLHQARDMTELPGGPSPYAETLADDAGLIAGLLDTVRLAAWEKWREAFSSAAFGRLKSCRGDSYDPALQEQVKSLRDDVKKTVIRLADEWFVRSPADYTAELQALAPQMKSLAELVITFGDRYEAAKREKGLLDFGDLEHYALRILRDPESSPQAAVPSSAALDYQQRFREILLDEYQDTNEVQEAIVSLIAKSQPGNVFMVGDVKQSIYGFRLAEPGLFLAKYKAFHIWTKDGMIAGGEDLGANRSSSTALSGLRIDLARNFRSRSRVLEAVNHVFRLIMREPVGEMDYDSRAELIYGDGYPSDEDADQSLLASDRDPYAVELILLEAGSKPGEAAPAENREPDGSDDTEVEEEELESAQLEARCIAAEIKRLMGQDGSGRPPFAVFDAKNKLHRPLAYRDIVILLRAATSLAPSVLDELQSAGIPAYADLATGYFAATEIDVMMSLLHLIDNPDQDIPLAGVLRSPIVGLGADRLARIRTVRKSGSYWQAVNEAAKTDAPFIDDETRSLLRRFLSALDGWRSLARREPIGDLLHALYRDTGYYDFVGGLPGGFQRQANLRALVDRARQYERNASSRGLFRFLRFLGRMRETGTDLGAARAIGEQEDVVRVVSIHKSKGLEFPVVFAAGLGRQFNRQDLNGPFLRHKKLGFGPRMVEQVTRVTYPTLPQLAIRSRMKAELLAEEMRVLYVALTRPKEKLYLIGTTKDAARELEKWGRIAEAGTAKGLPAHSVASARRYMDWIGPASLSAGSEWVSGTGQAGAEAAAAADTGLLESAAHATRPWICRVAPASAFMRAASAEAQAVLHNEESEPLWNIVQRLEPVSVPTSEAGERAYASLSWNDPHAQATRAAAKTSITAMKQWRKAAEDQITSSVTSNEEYTAIAEVDNEESRHPAWNPEELPDGGLLTYRLRRPKFLSSKKMTPAERGSAVHLVMQHLPLRLDMNEGQIAELLERLVEARILTREQMEAIDPAGIAAFCQDDLFKRMCVATRIWREWPFSTGIPAADAHPGLFTDNPGEETVMIQGVIDCLFPEGDGFVLIDYKTDSVRDGGWEEAAEQHRFQMEQYAAAVGRILGQPVTEGYIYFMNGGQSVRLYESK